MSGICGISFHGNDCQLNQNHLSSMVQAMNLFGQNENYIWNTEEVGVGVIGFQGKLAGVAKRAHNGKELVLAFYGSIYNEHDLFNENGNSSDTINKLIGLYLKDGIDFIKTLHGEFVLSLWDCSIDTMFLATDQFRICPLFYYKDADKLVFASTMKGILSSRFPLNLTINPRAIVRIVAASFIPTPQTIFQEVKKLPPGNILTYHKGETKVAPYWDINFLNPRGVGEAELSQKLKYHFNESISVRLQKELDPEKVGTFLSGGVDSSAVTGILTKLAKRPIKSFSIGFDEEKFNELSYARIAAKAFGADHYEYLVSPKDVCDSIPVLLDAFDEPFANASAIPTYFCSKLAKEHNVDVLYAGDGGDELFAGNERYVTQRIFDYYYKVPTWFREPLAKPIIFLLANKSNFQLFVKLKKYIQRASIPYPERLSSWGVFEVICMEELLGDNLLDMVGSDYNVNESMFSCYHRAQAKSELDRQLYIDLKLAITDNDLFKVTRMTEMAGVVVRYPFLDKCLAEFSMTIPYNVKMRGRRLRSFFKDTFSDVLPPETRAKQKHGFGLPIPIWLRTNKQLNEMMNDLVLSPQSLQREYFKKKTLEKLVVSHKTDETSFYGTLLWNLMILELWHRKYKEEK